MKDKLKEEFNWVRNLEQSIVERLQLILKEEKQKKERKAKNNTLKMLHQKQEEKNKDIDRFECEVMKLKHLMRVCEATKKEKQEKRRNVKWQK